jgi:hypothetical protein
MPVMKWTVVPEWLRKPVIFEINTDWYDLEIFNNLPEFIRNKILESTEVKKLFWIETFEEQEENMKKEAITTKEAEDVFLEAKTPWEFGQ